MPADDADLQISPIDANYLEVVRLQSRLCIEELLKMQPAFRTIVLTASILTACTVSAQEDLLGKYVVVKKWGVRMTDQGQNFNTDVLLGDTFRVSKVDGDRLWVGPGWIKKDDVVPFDKSMEFFTAEIRRDPSAANFHNRAIFLVNRNEIDRAIADQSIAIGIAPSAPGYSARSVMWQKKGEQKRALADADEAIRLDPAETVYYNDRASILRNQKQYDKAILDCDEAIRLNPKFVTPYYNRALIWRDKGDRTKAIADFEETIRIDSRFPWPYDELAWIWATCPEKEVRNGSKAVEWATKACELTNWSSSDALDTLAAAYAEKGDFEAALKRQTEALALKLAHWSEKTEKDERARLELYKSKKPYRAQAVEPSDRSATPR